MPLYEYICQKDGQVLELMRPMDQADDPVDDPDGHGRTFARKISTFSPTSGSANLPMGGGCGCGNPNGPCSMG